MFDFSVGEIVVIGAVALIAIGPKELPGVLRAVGQWTTKIRRMASEFQSQFQEALREAEMADLKKEVDTLTDTAKGFTSQFDDPLNLKEATKWEPKTEETKSEETKTEETKADETKPADAAKPEEAQPLDFASVTPDGYAVPETVASTAAQTGSDTVPAPSASEPHVASAAGPAHPAAPPAQPPMPEGSGQKVTEGGVGAGAAGVSGGGHA
jgi:sec-independent protein translocase protein TatB